MKNLLFLLFIEIAVLHMLYPDQLQLDWQGISMLVLGCMIFSWPVISPNIDRIVGMMRKIKYKDAEIELREEARELTETVLLTEQSMPISGYYDPNGPTITQGKPSEEDEILELASRDKDLAIVRLFRSIERNLEDLISELGLTPKIRTHNIFEYGRVLYSHGDINREMMKSIAAIYKFKNNHSHYSQSDVTDQAITEVIDSGIRLLRIAKAIPSNKYTVTEIGITVYDQQFPGSFRQLPVQGVVIELISAAHHEKRIVPAGRQFQVGEVVQWKWDNSSVYDKAYYVEASAGQYLQAWRYSPAFVG